MNEEKYNRILNIIRKSPARLRFIIWMDRACVFVTIIGYVGLLAYLFKTDMGRMIDVIVVSGVGFLGLSLFRHIINSKRPYEVYDIKPLIEKDKGHSFPSRHTFSIMMVAFSIMTVSVSFGFIYLAFGLMLGVLRVVEGVHFIMDVVAGAFIALACASVYLFIW